MPSKEVIPLNFETVLIPNERYTDFDIPVFQCFSGWEKVYPFLQENNYLVIFESERKASATNSTLARELEEADTRAYLELQGMPGFRGYFRGPLDQSTRRCRSFCIWTSEDTAKISSQQSTHIAAMQLTVKAYESYDVKRYVVKNGQLERVTTQNIHYARPSAPYIPRDSQESERWRDNYSSAAFEG